MAIGPLRLLHRGVHGPLVSHSAIAPWIHGALMSLGAIAPWIHGALGAKHAITPGSGT
jgi:hypothetical protein